MKKVYVFCDFETTGLFDFKNPHKTVYPIEVGLIFTDENYVIYDTYQELIKWPSLINQIKHIHNYWPEEYYDAFEVHGINPLWYNLKSKDYIKVSDNIFNKMTDIKNSITKNSKEKVRFILFSDNIQFEFRLMEQLLRDYCILHDLEWPFHYCGYDSSEFLIKTGIGDPKPEHRALRDAALLHQHMVRANEKIKK